MGKYFAYARVSTPRQGERGVSLPEQRDAIERYAHMRGLEITRWFVEKESASQTGRPAFNEMLRLLRLKTAQGVIIHKIDRSMRNIEDWAYVSKLVDSGVQIHFATESVDLETVGGRLSADIQAMVAVHYSRNLREEVKKGLYGRLKQGFYPFQAPIGYLDQGSAKPKIPDPTRAPLIRELFKLYASGRFSLPDLAQEMFKCGLRNLNGGPVSVNGLVTILRNPFYIGLMRIVKTGQTFESNHEPLVTTGTFETVQAVFTGKRVDRSKNRIFLYSRIARCKTCGYSLIAERQKGHVYYRCHKRPFKNLCPVTSVREEQIDKAVLNQLAEVDLSDHEWKLAKLCLSTWTHDLEKNRTAITQALQLQLDRVQGQLAKLTDLLIEGTIDKSLFEDKQRSLLLEQVRIKEKLTETRNGSFAAVDRVEGTVELAKSPSLLYKTASAEQKRELLKALLSNLAVSEKNVEITLALPFRIIAEREKPLFGRPYRGTCRTWEEIIQTLQSHFEGTPSGGNIKRGSLPETA
jgi:site-specific DNA recombinase